MYPRNRNTAVQRHYRAGFELQELVVKRQHQLPVSLFGCGGAGVGGSNGGFHVKWRNLSACDRTVKIPEADGDQPLVPARAILLVQQYEIAHAIRASRKARRL